MEKHMFKCLLMTVCALLSYTTCLTAQDAIYGTNDGTKKVSYWGTAKKENYDVALHITDTALVGKTIKGVIIPFADIAGIKGRGAAFLTKDLVLKSRVNAPDVRCDSFDIKSGNVRVDFAEPYTITGDGIFVGYSISLDQAMPSPIAVIDLDDANPENLYVHTSRTYLKWRALASELGSETAIQVIIGGIPKDVASISGTGDITTTINADVEYPVSIKNLGSTAISSIDYSYTAAGTKETRHIDLDPPISSHIGTTRNVSLPLTTFADPGTYKLDITLDKVNGIDNTAEQKEVSTYVYVYKHFPTKRALLEEYTGTWCGWCPRGFVALERMNRLLGDDFIGISYHNKDPMAFTRNYPNDVSGFPAAYIDRAHSTDAYCADNYDYQFNIYDFYQEWNKTHSAPADITVQAYFTDKSKEQIEAKASVEFTLNQPVNKYQLSFILTADGLSEEGDTCHQRSWAQANYYQGLGKYYTGDDFKVFTDGSSEGSSVPSVKGLTYNFVVCGWSGQSYISNSLPAQVDAEQPVSYTYTFDLSNSVNDSGLPIIQDKEKLNVVALLIDTTTGYVANAYKTKVYTDEATGIHGIESTANPLTTSREYFTIDGKRLAKPQHGLNIVRFSNGMTKKIVIK